MMIANWSLTAFHHIEFFVSNALQASFWYSANFGFKRFSVRKTEHSLSIAIRNGKVIFVFTSYDDSNEEYATHIIDHGDSVKDVAFRVDNLAATVQNITANGGRVLKPLETIRDNYGCIKRATVSAANSDMCHSLFEIGDYGGIFLPEYVQCDDCGLFSQLEEIPLVGLDHVVENYPSDFMDNVSRWYFDNLRLKRFWSIDDTICHSEYSAMKATLLTNETKTVQITLVEPVSNSRKGRSQIQEYLDYHGGPGIQHVALLVNDIITSVKLMKKRSVEFLTVPECYYDDLEKRLSRSTVHISEDLRKLRELNILVDFDESGYLLQIFTKPVQDRPTLFVEIIQRHNFNGFGAGNVKALFDAIEREQAKRGTLVTQNADINGFYS